MKHSGDRQFECAFCCKKCVTKSDLNSHLLTHQDGGRKPQEKNILCEICSRRFRNLRQLKVHMAMHTGEKPFVCDVCPFKTHDKKCLSLHKKIHDDKIREFECHKCSKRFLLKSQLTKHMVRHSGDKNIKCTMCSKMYFTINEVHNHINRFHRHDKPYQCTDCLRKYAKKSSLEDHIRFVHKGETPPKPFQCGECKKLFRDKSALNVHIRCTHSGEKPFECSHCSAKFARFESLKYHMKRHDASYRSCSICLLEFPSRRGLINHKRSRHKQT